MRVAGLDIDAAPLSAPLPIARAQVPATQWTRTAQAVREAGGRLIALWGVDRSEGAAGAQLVVCAAYALREGLRWLELPPVGPDQAAPDLASVFPSAARMQRATTDLLGVRFDGARDARPWLDHGVWPAGLRPLRRDTLPGPAATHPLPADYPFVAVEGDGVHEIAVGPVHAGIIEPGHFRFSVVGEKVLRLEQRLGYVHKGIERRFTELAPLQAHRMAGRISGDSTVAHAWAYCMA
ncbi:MAG: NADH-quinone oxidoreductase subunit C, partial [Burkholderiales bacterium]